MTPVQLETIFAADKAPRTFPPQCCLQMYNIYPLNGMPVALDNSMTVVLRSPSIAGLLRTRQGLHVLATPTR